MGKAAILTLFGSLAVAVMLLSYWLESRSKWLALIFALASAATSAHSALAGVYPITGIEALRALVAVQRFPKTHQLESGRA